MARRRIRVIHSYFSERIDFVSFDEIHKASPKGVNAYSDAGEMASRVVLNF